MSRNVRGLGWIDAFDASAHAAPRAPEPASRHGGPRRGSAVARAGKVTPATTIDLDTEEAAGIGQLLQTRHAMARKGRDLLPEPLQ